MKKRYLAFALSAFIVTGITSSRLAAQTQEETTNSAATDKAAQRSPEKVVEMMASRLNLTADQKTKITPIVADRQRNLRALRSDTSLRKFQKMRKMKSIVEESENKIEALLTDAQKKEYAELKKEMREQAKERGSNGGELN